jgi:hypothetical protein
MESWISTPRSKGTYRVSRQGVSNHGPGIGRALAGIRHYAGAEFLSNRHYANVTSSLDIFKNDTLLFRPGEKYCTRLTDSFC